MPSETEEDIEKLLLHLPQDHPFCRHAAAVLVDPQTPTPDPEPVLHAALARGLHWQVERRAAWWLIQHAAWTEPQRRSIHEALSRTVARGIEARKSGRNLLRWFGRSMLFWMFALIICTDAVRNPWFDTLGLILNAIIGTVLYSVYSLPLSLWLDRRNTRRLMSAVEALGEYGRPTDLATLVAATLHSSLSEAACNSLGQVISRLRREDYGTLPMQAIPSICRILPSLSPHVVSLVLEAFFLVGDGQAIPAVESLSRNAIRAEIRQRAAALLPVLQQRAQEAEDISLLLRAGDAPSEDGKTLLRAARENARSDTSQLLRVAPAEGREA